MRYSDSRLSVKQCLQFDLAPLKHADETSGASPELQEHSTVLNKLTPPAASAETSRVRRPARGKRPPKVSCLLVTGNREAFAQCAIDAYAAQTYSHKELVIVDSGNTPLDLTNRADVPGIRYFRALSGRTLGELRNLALSLARGEYFIQWDDDDYSAPERVQVQWEYTRNKAASIMRRVILIWPERLYSAISKPRLWEGTLMARRDLQLRFPPLPRAEDTPVIEGMIKARIPLGIIDEPELYHYIYHGNNTSSRQHFAKLCAYPSIIPLPFEKVFAKLPAALKQTLLSTRERPAVSSSHD